MLASDLNNPEFAGAVNPDDLLSVEFYWAEPIDKWESEKQGKAVKMARQVFVRIMRPGDQLSILEVPARDDHKKRWPAKWLFFQMQEGMVAEAEIPGWKIEEWDELNADQVRELAHKRFQTVEQIAGASDAQVQGIGMGGLALREKAKIALRGKMGVEVKEELEKRDEKLEALQAQNEALQKQMAEMAETMAKLAAPKPRGRPKKDK